MNAGVMFINIYLFIYNSFDEFIDCKDIKCMLCHFLVEIH